MGTSLDSSNDKDTAIPDFDTLAQAVSSGEMQGIDRIMSGEVPDKKEEVEDTSSDENTEEGVTDEDSPEEDNNSTDEVEDSSESNESESDNESDKKEAATSKTEKDSKKSAASTAKTDGVKKEQDTDTNRELQELRSSAGRVPFLQRRLAELERELRATKAGARISTGVDTKNSKPTAADLSKIELDPDTQKEIDDLKEIDPVMAKTLERIAKMSIANAEHQAASVVTTFTEEEQRAEDARFFMEQKALLTQKIPQHDQIFASQEWKQWKETLSPGLRALAESGYADEVERAIYAFAADMQARQNGGTGAQPKKAAGEETPAVTDEANERIKAARERKQAASVDVKSTAGKASKVVDENAMFAEFYNKIGKEQHIL